MATVRQLPATEWHEYFDERTKQFFRDPNPEAAYVELISRGAR
jgi:hypothetical protein